MPPAANESKSGNIFKSYILTPVAYDVSLVWETLRRTYSQSLVTVSPPKLILHSVCKRGEITDWRTDDPTPNAPSDHSGQGIKSVLRNKSD